MKKVLVAILTGVLLVGGVPFQAKADTTKFQDLKNEVIQADEGYNESNENGVIYRWCTYVCDCEDNCVENGFSFIVKDQYGESYIFDKEYDREDLSGTEYLVVTKGDKTNVIEAYQLTEKGLKNMYHLTPNGIVPFKGLMW